MTQTTGPGDEQDAVAVTAAKAALRRRIRTDRVRRLGTDGGRDRQRRDDRILAHLVAELGRNDVTVGATPGDVAAYCPVTGEPGGEDLPDRLAATGRTVWVPLADPESRQLRWLPWRGRENSRTAAFGIREPIPAAGETALDSDALLAQVGAVIIPALAVGGQGLRLGQGGGFYDRALSVDAFAPSNPVERGRLLAIVDNEEYGIPVPGTHLDIEIPVVVTDTGVFRTGALDRP